MPSGRLQLLLRMDACVALGEEPDELDGPLLVDRASLERLLQRFVDFADPPAALRPRPSQLLTDCGAVESVERKRRCCDGDQ
jgi:hypothetical protein